jgi:hypothetical protein
MELIGIVMNAENDIMMRKCKRLLMAHSKVPPIAIQDAIHALHASFYMLDQGRHEIVRELNSRAIGLLSDYLQEQDRKEM